MDNRKTVIIVLLAILAVYLIPVAVMSWGVVPYVDETADSGLPAEAAADRLLDEESAERIGEKDRKAVQQAVDTVPSYLTQKYNIEFSHGMIGDISTDGRLTEIKMRDGYSVYLCPSKDIITDNLELKRFKEDFIKKYVDAASVTDEYRIETFEVSSVVPADFANGSRFEGLSEKVRYDGDVDAFLRKYSKSLYLRLDIEWYTDDGSAHADENEAFLQSIKSASPSLADSTVSIVVPK